MFGPRLIAAAVLAGSLCLLAASKADAASVTLAWDPNAESGLLGYKVYYDTDSGPPYSGTQAHEGPSPIDVPLASLQNPQTPTYVLTGLPSCQKFYFAVTAYNSSGESGYSTEVPADVVASGNPVSAVPGNTAGSLFVSWAAKPSDDPGPLSLYRVYYDTDSGDPYSAPGSPLTLQVVNLSDPKNPGTTLSGLTPGTTYYVMVESACDNGMTKKSDEASGLTAATGTAGAAGAGGGTGAIGGGGANSGGTTAGGATGGGSGGTIGKGGSGASSGSGASPSGGSSAKPGGNSDDGGCGCRVTPRERNRTPGLWLAALALWVVRRSRAHA